MIRALIFIAGAGGLFWWWWQQRQPAAVHEPIATPTPGDDQVPQPYSIEDQSPMSPALLDPNVAAVVQLVLQIAPAEGQDPALVLGIIEQESGFNPTAYNPRDPNGGSWGLMQMQLPTAQDMGYAGEDPRGLFDPATAITLGARYLTWIRSYLARYGITGENAMVAAYNAGVGRVRQGLPNYPYVTAVNGRREKWAGVLASMVGA